MVKTTGTRVYLDVDGVKRALEALHVMPSVEDVIRERVAKILIAGGALVVSAEEFEALQVTRAPEPNRPKVRVYESKWLHPHQRLAVPKDLIGDYAHMPWIEI